MKILPEFEATRLAEAVEALSPDQIDELTFGVILLDTANNVRIHNRTERESSGYRDRPNVGRLFFTDVAPCMNNPQFKGRIDAARKAGQLDISFSYVGDFGDHNRELNVRVQSAADGGVWIFIKRG